MSNRWKRIILVVFWTCVYAAFFDKGLSIVIAALLCALIAAELEEKKERNVENI